MAFLESLDEQLRFARKSLEFDWNDVYLTKFGQVKCVGVWIGVNECGPAKLKMFDGIVTIARYLEILNDIVSPLSVANENFMYVQERNDVTNSVQVRQWLWAHQINWTYWPSETDFSPVSIFFERMQTFVYGKLPLTISEVKQFIKRFFEEMREDDFIFDDYEIMRRCLKDITEDPSLM